MPKEFVKLVGLTVNCRISNFHHRKVRYPINQRKNIQNLGIILDVPRRSLKMGTILDETPI